jgi:hypothetical protein
MEEKKKRTNSQNSQSEERIEEANNANDASTVTVKTNITDTSAALATTTDNYSTSSSSSSSSSSLFGFQLNKTQLEAMGAKILNSADEYLSSWTDSIDPTASKRVVVVAGKASTDTQTVLDNARRFRLLALQEDAETYIIPPMDVDTFQKWCLSLSCEERQSLQTQVLKHYPIVGHQFKELVPSSVHEDDFWSHYLYKASLLAAQEQRKINLLTQHDIKHDDEEEEVAWEDEEEKQVEESQLDTTLSLQPSGPSSSQLSVASSDAESWVDVEDKKDISPPVSSSSSSSSSRVQNYAPTSSLPPVPSTSVPTLCSTSTMVVDQNQNHLNLVEEEDVDWGGNDDDIDEKTSTSQGQDWGEWS